MSEVFFILTVIYVAYIVSTVTEVGEQIKKSSKTNDPTSTDTPAAPVQSKAAEQAPSKPQKVTAKAKPVTTKAKSVKPKTSAAKFELRTVEMKNPKTGEQAKVANNYRMVKRWVKEALVEEGLLEKIYKTKEMDDTAKAKVSEALSIIKAMDKYKV